MSSQDQIRNILDDHPQVAFLQVLVSDNCISNFILSETRISIWWSYL